MSELSTAAMPAACDRARPSQVANPGEAAGGSKVRFHFIDGLRGIAALMVMAHHFYHTAPASIQGPLRSILPWPIHEGLEWGSAGVTLFFIISGFVIAHSVGTSRITPAYFGNFALRRSLRLDPPYWAAILLSLAVIVASNLVLKGRQAPLPDGRVLLINLFYLQNVFHVEHILLVSWTLTHEIQFYVLFILLFGLAQKLSGSGREYPHPAWLFLCFGISSFCSFMYPSRTVRFEAITCVGTWHLFCIGVFCYLIYRKRISLFLGLAYLLPISALLVYYRSEFYPMTLGTLAALLIACATDNLGRWLNHPVFQYFGRISYSLYLVHWPVGCRILNLAHHLKLNSLAGSLVAFLAATAASVIVAELMHRFIEAPSMQLAKRLKSPAKDRIPVPALP